MAIIRRCLLAMAAAVLVLATSCTVNRRPVIASLEAEAHWTAPLGSLRVTCNASDPEGDRLSYSWSTTGGSIVGAGAVVNWTAPATVGMYDITVVVTDGQGKNATKSLTVFASNGPPPTIERLTVTAEHRYLTKTTTGYMVSRGQEYTIKCIASGTGTVLYEWSSTAGNISGNGSQITWTAPNTEVTIMVTVTVKVFDGAGNWIRRSILFQVVACPECVTW